MLAGARAKLPREGSIPEWAAFSPRRHCCRRFRSPCRSRSTPTPPTIGTTRIENVARMIGRIEPTPLIPSRHRHAGAVGPRANCVTDRAEAAAIPECALIVAASVLGVRTQKGQWWLPAVRLERVLELESPRCRPTISITAKKVDCIGWQSSQTDLLTITGNYRLRFFEHSYSVLRETISRQDDDDKHRQINQAASKLAATG